MNQEQEETLAVIVYNGHWGHYEQWGFRKLFKMEMNYFFLQGIEKSVSDLFIDVPQKYNYQWR